MTKQFITLNGKRYDTHTGMPVDESPVASQARPKTAPSHSTSVHQSTQRSQTLNRRLIKKPAAASNLRAKTPQTIKKSPLVTKFAKPSAAAPHHQSYSNDTPPQEHPLVAKTHHAQKHAHKRNHPVQHTHKPSHIIKQEAIAKALETAPPHHARQHRAPRRGTRMTSIASATFALLLLGGYFTYLNMPNLSVRVAAMNAGIDASYPGYQPDGYKLQGPVAYNEGQVSMVFKSTTNPRNFTVNQSKTNWDGTAVAENYVRPKWGDDVLSYVEHGITIYTHEGNAAWVNGGILYTIEGDAPLSPTQIRNIATSM